MRQGIHSEQCKSPSAKSPFLRGKGLQGGGASCTRWITRSLLIRARDSECPTVGDTCRAAADVPVRIPPKPDAVGRRSSPARGRQCARMLDVGERCGRRAGEKPEASGRTRFSQALGAALSDGEIAESCGCNSSSKLGKTLENLEISYEFQYRSFMQVFQNTNLAAHAHREAACSCAATRRHCRLASAAGG